MLISVSDILLAVISNRIILSGLILKLLSAVIRSMALGNAPMPIAARMDAAASPNTTQNNTFIIPAVFFFFFFFFFYFGIFISSFVTRIIHGILY